MIKQVLEKHIFRKTVFIVIKTIFQIYCEFMGFLLSEKTYFQIPYLCRTEDWLTGQVGRPDRSTAPQAGRPGRSTDVHKSVHVLESLGRSTGPVDRDESSALRMFRSTGLVDRYCPTVTFLTVGGRPGRSTDACQSCQLSLTASFVQGLYKPHLFGDFGQVF